ncbi:dimethylsulfonioproprionate lyase family protein [Pseudomonas alliivorans]|nr:dimethylsulfonioproprionate lyase family protein [Pseudomonas alliivorans]
MQNTCGLSEQELLMHGVILREALLRILVRYSLTRASAIDEVDVCARALRYARLDIGLAPFSGSALPPSLAPTLVEALSAAPRPDRDFEALLSALGVLLPNSRWIQRFATGNDEVEFEDRHRHAFIFGKGGLFQCSTMTLGLALMAPELNYPFHRHPPAEFYLVLSEGDWYREDAGWWSPGAGGMVFNPRSAMHSMRSTRKPLLALWGLIDPVPHSVPSGVSNNFNLTTP